MGAWDKVKGFFGRVWKGIKKASRGIGNFLTGTGSKLYDSLKPALSMIPGASAVTSVVDKLLPVAGTALSNLGNT